MIELKPCPFCGGAATLIRDAVKGSGDGYVLDTYAHAVRCSRCYAQSYRESQSPLCMFTKHTTMEFRANPILMAKVEMEYDQYIDSLKDKAIAAWNTRRAQ